MRLSARHTRRWNTVPRMSTGTRERSPSPDRNEAMLSRISPSAAGSSISSAALNSSPISRRSFASSSPSLTAQRPREVAATRVLPIGSVKTA